MSLTSNELDFTKSFLNHPTYRMNRVLPQSGASTQFITVSGGLETIFEIPADPINLSRSYISFDFNLAPTAVGDANRVFCDCIPEFRSIYLYTKGGVYACRLDDVGYVTKVTMNSKTPINEFLTYGVATILNGATAADPGVAYALMAPQTSAAASGNLSHFQRSNLAVPSIQRPTLGTAGGNIGYTEPAYILTSVLEPAVGANNFASNSNIHVRINLALLKETIFEVDRDILFNEIMYLKLIMNNSNKVAYKTTGITNPENGVGAITNANQIITLQNLTLYLATENNPFYINQIREQMLKPEGLTYLIPYVTTFRNSPPASLLQNISIRLNRADGAKLLKIYHTVFNIADTANTAYDHNNINGAKATSYYTNLNNRRIQEFELDCTTLDDWNQIRENLTGTVLQSSNIYQYNWFHLDRFDGLKGVDSATNIDTGLDLSVEQKWDIYMRMAANLQYNHFTIAVTQKLLTINNFGVSCN